MWNTNCVAREFAVMYFDQMPFKRRPQFDGRTKRTFTPQKTVAAERSIREQWLGQVGSIHANFDGAVKIHVEIARPIAQSTSKRMVGHEDVQRPDADNIGKAFLDALNGVAFKDDSHVVEFSVVKLPRTSKERGIRATVQVRYYENKFTDSLED